MKIKTGRGWTWEFSLGMCNWAEPTKSILEERNRDMPWTDKKTVRVRIVKESDYRRLVRAAKKK